MAVGVGRRGSDRSTRVQGQPRAQVRQGEGEQRPCVFCSKIVMNICFRCAARPAGWVLSYGGLTGYTR